MKNKLLIISLIVTLFSSCDIRKFTTYEGDLYIHFANTIADSVNLSFMYFPGEDVIEYEIVMKTAGLAPTRDVLYKLVVDQTATTAAPENYTIPETFTLGAGNYSDTARIKLHSTSNLNDENVRLVLRVEATSEVGVGKLENSVAIIWITNTVSKPTWWYNTDYDWMWLGDYTDAKYKLFIEVTGEYDLTGWTDTQIRDICLKFKRYLLANPTLDENGELMTVPVAGLD